MKRLVFAAATLGLALLVALGVSAQAAAPAIDSVHHCTAQAATDDPVPVECPFCGGDATLHVKRMNEIAVMSSRLAYRVLDEAIF